MKVKSMPPKSKYSKIRRNIYLFVIIAGLLHIFFPTVVYASDIFKNDVQDVYVTITENVAETNEILTKGFQFCQISPYNVLNGFSSSAIINIRGAAEQIALVVATLLLLVDFFKKTVTFEWSSKWENILVFLVKVIVVKQIVQNTDVIISYIYAIFNWMNQGAIIGAVGGTDLLPCGNVMNYTIVYKESLLHDMWTEGVVDGWQNFFYHGTGYDQNMTYTISWDAVHMFFPGANLDAAGHWIVPDGTTFQYTDHLFEYPTDTMFQPTMKIIFMQPYFLVMKAVAYIIFVMAMGRVFELCIYTLFAPLPLATFAGDGTHDVGKNFIKSYIATVMQIAVMVAMFTIYLAINKYITTTAPFAGTPLIQFVVLISLGLGVTKSGQWAKRICGAT